MCLIASPVRADTARACPRADSEVLCLVKNSQSLSSPPPLPYLRLPGRGEGEMAALPFWEWCPTPRADHWDNPPGSAWDSRSSVVTLVKVRLPSGSQFPHF